MSIASKKSYRATGRKLVRNRSGAVSLEFALVMPIFILSITTTFLGGMWIYQTQQYAAIAKFLGRKAIVRGQMADKLGPWGPSTMTGSIGDGSEIGTLLANKYSNGQPMDIYYQLTWPDGGNNGLSGHRVEVLITSSNPSTLNAGTTFELSARVVLDLAH
jgi:hypothetical protein